MRSKHGSVASFPPNRWLYSISPLRYLLEHHGHSWLAFQVDRRAEQSRAGMCPMIQLVAVSSRLCTKCIRVHQCRFENRLDREPGRTRPGRKAHWQPVNRERAQSASSLVFALPNLRFRTFRTQPKGLFISWLYVKFGSGILGARSVLVSYCQVEPRSSQGLIRLAPRAGHVE